MVRLPDHGARGAPFGRDELVRFLNDNKTTRACCSAAISSAPYAWAELSRAGAAHQQRPHLHRTLWIGLFPGLHAEHLEYLLLSC